VYLVVRVYLSNLVCWKPKNIRYVLNITVL